MGAGNVKLAFVHWGDLPATPFRLLVYMCLRSKDGESPVYWGGREDLAFALGRVVPEGDDPESRRARNAAFKAVKDALAVLARRGAISTAERARPGRNAVYRIHLARPGAESAPHEPVDNPVDNSETGHENRAPYGARNPYPMGHENRARWGTETVPRSRGMGHENRAPEDEYLQKNGEQSPGVGGAGSHQPDGDAHARARERETNEHTPERARFVSYRDAAAYLLTIPGDLRDRVVGAATAELGPGASREAVLIRAANLAYGSAA
jgi:hypothetical protein